MTNEVVPHCWLTETDCMVFVDDMILQNHYKFEVGFDTCSANITLHDIAFEKIEMFFDILLSNSIIITKNDFESKKFNFKNNYIELPSMLNDQTLGCLIYSKLIALVGEDLDINYLKITSSLGKNIRYHIDMDSPEIHSLMPTKAEWWDSDDIKFNPWWLRDDPATYDQLLSDEDLYKGEFSWEDHFGEELEMVKNSDIKNKFQIIKGGKDAVKPNE